MVIQKYLLRLNCRFFFRVMFDFCIGNIKHYFSFNLSLIYYIEIYEDLNEVLYNKY